jgi:hypothetical protein
VAVPTDSRHASQREQTSTTLAVAPCTRYYVASRREAPTAREWKLVVSHQEPVGGCDPARELAKAKG